MVNGEEEIHSEDKVGGNAEINKSGNTKNETRYVKKLRRENSYISEKIVERKYS